MESSNSDDVMDDLTNVVINETEDFNVQNVSGDGENYPKTNY
jgi:hypothetical protein